MAYVIMSIQYWHPNIGYSVINRNHDMYPVDIKVTIAASEIERKIYIAHIDCPLTKLKIIFINRFCTAPTIEAEIFQQKKLCDQKVICQAKI